MSHKDKKLNDQDLDTDSLTPLLGEPGRNLTRKYEKKPFKQRFKCTVEKVIKFAERNLAPSSEVTNEPVMDKMGSAEEFYDQVWDHLGIIFDGHVFGIPKLADVINMFLPSEAIKLN